MIGCKFTESYLWFLNNYVGGDIGGDEVYSVYESSLPSAGNIVHSHFSNQENEIVHPNQLVVLTSDFAEIFYFDYSEYDGNECPIYLKIGVDGKPRHYANDFYEFLYKRINEYL